MDREITKSERRAANGMRYIWLGLTIAALVFCAYAMRKYLKKSAKSSELVIATVDRGIVRSTLSAAGVVMASSERIINAPVTTEIQEVELISGATVNEGDVIMNLNEEFVRLEYDQLRDQLSLRNNNMSRLKLEYDKNLKDLDYTDQIKQLQINRLAAEVNNQKRLLEIGGSTQEELEASQMALRIAKLEKKQLENELQFRRAVNSTDKNNLQLEYDIQYKQLRELGKKLNQTELKSPVSGVITWINDNIGETVTEGEPLVRIANLTRYEIEATTTDRNLNELYVGMPAEVRIGRSKLEGSIDRINPEVVNNTIRFYIALEDANNEVLRPNLRSEVLLIKGIKEDVLRSKRGSILTGAASQYVYKVSGNTAEKVRIRKGLISSDYFEVVDGLQAGDRIIISDVDEYEHMDQFQIKG